MVSNVKIDDALMDQALQLSGLRTKKDAVTLALEEFVARRRQKEFLNLKGSIDFDPDYDYKGQRHRC